MFPTLCPTPAIVLLLTHVRARARSYVDKMIPGTLAFTTELNSIDEFIWDPTSQHHHQQQQQPKDRARPHGR